MFVFLRVLHNTLKIFLRFYYNIVLTRSIVIRTKAFYHGIPSLRQKICSSWGKFWRRPFYWNFINGWNVFQLKAAWINILQQISWLKIIFSWKTLTTLPEKTYYAANILFYYNTKLWKYSFDTSKYSQPYSWCVNFVLRMKLKVSINKRYFYIFFRFTKSSVLIHQYFFKSNWYVLFLKKSWFQRSFKLKSTCSKPKMVP